MSGCLKSVSWVSLLLMAVGCGSSAQLEGRVPVYPVQGTVTFKGNPVEGAVVNFVSKGDNPVATGRTDASGKYSLTTYDSGDGAGEGDYVVLVTKVEVPAVPEKEPTGYPGDKNRSKFLLPEKYSNSIQSPLTAEVTKESKKKSFDFELNL